MLHHWSHAGMKMAASVSQVLMVWPFVSNLLLLTSFFSTDAEEATLEKHIHIDESG